VRTETCDPDGNRIWKESTVSSQTDERKYIVDVVGKLPVILMEIDPESGSIVKSYIHANAQIFAKRNGGQAGTRYFYLHDRLGSVRQVINSYGSVVKYATFEPFGESIESGGSLEDPFGFTGQYFDEEIGEYYLRARQYNPQIARFTGRDPIFGDFQQPLTLHKYLYCGNDPLNRIDLAGLSASYLLGSFIGSIGTGSFVRQSGIVWDDQGNVGWMNLTGGCWGTANVSLGVSYGHSPNARSIKDMSGQFTSGGASSSWPFSLLIPGLTVGGEIFKAKGSDIWGWEFTIGGSALSPVEAHLHLTHTKIRPIGNWYTAVDEIDAYMSEMFESISSYADWVALNLVDALIRQASDGKYDGDYFGLDD